MIDVTSLFTRGLEHHIGALNAYPDTQPRIVAYLERLVRLRGVLECDFHAGKITGEDCGGADLHPVAAGIDLACPVRECRQPRRTRSTIRPRCR